MERFNIEQWKRKELLRYNKITSGRTFRQAMKLQNYLEERHTLEDGRVIITPEEGKWIGNPITFEDGTPLPFGFPGFPGRNFPAPSRPLSNPLFSVIDYFFKCQM